jgi:hypothetical protein
MRAPLLIDFPQPTRRLQDPGDVVPEAQELDEPHAQPRLAVYPSVHSRSGRPKFIGPAPQPPSWAERLRMRLRRVLGKETAP